MAPTDHTPPASAEMTWRCAELARRLRASEAEVARLRLVNARLAHLLVLARSPRAE